MVRALFSDRCRNVPGGLDSAAGHKRSPGRASARKTHEHPQLKAGVRFMGQLRLVIPRPERLAPAAAEQAYLAGAEGIPWECTTTQSGTSLAIERDTRESGYLYFPWNVPGRGLVMLCSGSLMERSKPYLLPVELARGTINRLRNQVSGWELGGMTMPAGLAPLMLAATTAFARAATGQSDAVAAEDAANAAIAKALEAIDLVTADYTQQVLEIRKSQQSPLPTLFGARLQAAPPLELGARFLMAFNTALVSPVWHLAEPKLGAFDWEALDAQVEWCKSQNLRTCFGPLMQFDKHLLPDWLFLDDEYDEVQLSTLQFIDAVVKRYRGRVQLWHVAGGMNLNGAFDFTEEQRLRLVVEAVDRVRALDARTPMIVSFDQPWGEYIARQDQELTPLHFADTLVRGELGLAGIGLTMNLGYWPGGTLPRDPLEVSRQLDRWSQLGVPLVVFLTVPSEDTVDRRAQHPGRVLMGLAADVVTPSWQQQTLQWLLPLIIAKQSVQAVIIGQWRDDLPHDFAHGGLCDARGRPKPALASVTQIRKQLLG
jgi:hypothetical protein